MFKFNVVGDIAGNFLTLKALLEKMPKDNMLISLGDPNDRGPRSSQVIDFLMQNGKTVQSNHAHMMVDHFENGGYYEKNLWTDWNGGNTTLQSYANSDVPREDLDFLKNCPMFIETDKYLFTHAPFNSYYTLSQASQLGKGFNGEFDVVSESSLIWNRSVPSKPNKNANGKINIFGHNSSDGVKVYTSDFSNGIKCYNNEEFKKHVNKAYAICLDTSSAKKLTGLDTATMTIYEQEYID